jgi:hypothetical protein
MNSKKTLIALSSAIALGILGATSAAIAGDRDDTASETQAQRDWVEWQRGVGHNVSGYVDNSGSAYGLAAPHEVQPRKHISR